MSKMINIINFLLRKAIESTNWEETEDEISATLIEQKVDDIYHYRHQIGDL